MRQRWIYVDGESYEVGQEPAPEVHHIIPDIEPFKSPDGAFIAGRAAWREHLKRTDSIEMGHSDMKAAQQDWAKRKDAHRARLAKAGNTVKEYTQQGEARPVQRTGLAVEMANRMHGRPQPGRKEMIKLTLDIAKRMNNRGR